LHVRKLTALDAENYLKLCETIDNESFRHNVKSNRSNPACVKFLFVRLMTEA